MKINEIINKHGNSEEQLIPILLEIQSLKEDKSVSENEIKEIAKEMGIAEAKIVSVISFYSAISDQPRGKYIIQVCTNVPCYVNGALNIVTALEKELGIKIGETTTDKLFTLEHTSCLGCCDMAPAIRINGVIYGNLDEPKIAAILSGLKESGGINE